MKADRPQIPPDGTSGESGDPPQPELGRGLRSALVVGGLLVLAAILFAQSFQPAGRIPYSRIKQLVRDGHAAEVHFKDKQLTVTLKSKQTLEVGQQKITAKQFHSVVPPIEDRELLPALEAAGVEVHADASSGSGMAMIYLLLPWLLFIGLFLWFRSRGAGDGIGSDRFKRYLKGYARAYEADQAPRVAFDDVAGCEQAKEEVREIVEFLAAPERFVRVGARVPRGVLLEGPPGTGKTLLARAVAGEAGVPFFSISASEFIEMFVGVGAARVRSLFQEAKKVAPAIVFIDEIDAIGRTRGTGLGGGHDEREQTLNQILSEMDGFEPHDALIVLAATNRPDVLDPALLRPGRFDRRVTLDLPDLAAREAILGVHVRAVPLEAGVDLRLVARATIGFSGADLRNLVNEAALASLRANREMVRQDDFDAARERIAFGTERSFAILPEEKHRLAIHEAGHTLVGWHHPDGDPVQKVTIVPRGRALGATFQLPEAERRTYTEEYLRGRLEVLLAGRAAELHITGQVSTGAEDDIQRATELARRMVAQWGMDPEVGPVDLSESRAHPFLGKEMAQPRRFSEATAHRLDQAVAGLLGECQAKAEVALKAHREAFLSLVDALEAQETLDREAIARILGGPPQAEPSGTNTPSLVAG